MPGRCKLPKKTGTNRTKSKIMFGSRKLSRRQIDTWIEVSDSAIESTRWLIIIFSIGSRVDFLGQKYSIIDFIEGLIQMVELISYFYVVIVYRIAKGNKYCSKNGG